MNPGAIDSRAALAALPVTRKADLHKLQSMQAPFGGLNATPVSQLSRVFMSPGPIFDPEGRGQDWWRFARPLWSAGLRPGMVVHNAFSYHFTPAAFMVEFALPRVLTVRLPCWASRRPRRRCRNRRNWRLRRWTESLRRCRFLMI